MIKTFIFCIMGSTLEWYDFSVFGVLAPILSRIFFPHHDKTVALLMTFAIFATGFIMRPLGGVFFGHIGDRFGRKKAIVSSVFLMTVTTVCIGLLPVKHFSTHVLLIFLLGLRLLQGFAVSGEYSGMFTFISEIVPRKNFFFYQSFVCFGAVGGLLLGTIVGSIALSFYHGNFASNAWRIPFLLSIFLGVLGLYLRLRIEESPTFSKIKVAHKRIKLPIKHVFVHYHRVIIFLILMTMVEAIGFYFVVVFYPSFINKLGISAHHYLHIVTIGLILLFIMTPIVGVLADKFNLVKVLAAGMIGYIVLPFPVLWAVSHHMNQFILLGEVMLFLPIIILEPLLAPTIALLFPSSVRYTGVALCINLVVCIFSGTSPLIALWLIKVTHLNYSPAFYIALAGLISLTTLCFAKKIIPLQYDKLTTQVDIN